MRLIDADALIRAHIVDNANDDAEVISRNDVNCAPTVDAVVHGQWVKDEIESEKHVEPIFYCSACENWEAWGYTELTNYCPNCGAKMDEVSE